MSDNATPHAAAVYEQEVRRTIPLHEVLLEQAVDVALTARPSPERWLDTGCGPGRLVEIARHHSPGTEFFLADPAPAMVDIARQRHPDLPAGRCLPVGSQDLPDLAPFSVITALQCHHYGDREARRRALQRCADLLKPGGALVTFENVRADTEDGHEMQRRRWAAWQREQGRNEAVVSAQLHREGTAFFPITVGELSADLSGAGFGLVELVWRSYAQAGFLAIKVATRPV